MLNFNYLQEQNENGKNLVETEDETYNSKTLLTILKRRKKYQKGCNNDIKTVKIQGFDKIIKRSRVATERQKMLILTEYENMKVWVKTLLSIYGSIPNIIKVIDQIITNQATNPFGASHFCAINTYGQFEKVIDFYERKNKLINIYVLIEKLLEGVSEEEKTLIKLKYEKRITIDGIAQKLMLDRRSVYRKLDAMVKKLASFSLSKGWTTTFISHQLENEPWVAEQYNAYKKESISKTKNKSLK